MQNKIPERLTELRKERGINMAEFARQIKIPIQTIYRWENHESIMNAEFIIKICDFFGCSADYLLGRTD